MARPRCRRLIEAEPNVTYFKPQGVPLRLLDEVTMPVEGLEALRLKDLDGLQNVEAARRMGVSRATFERVLAAARRAVAEALVGGKALRVEGGDFALAGPPGRCCREPELTDRGQQSDFPTDRCAQPSIERSTGASR